MKLIYDSLAIVNLTENDIIMNYIINGGFIFLPNILQHELFLVPLDLPA